MAKELSASEYAEMMIFGKTMEQLDKETPSIKKFCTDLVNSGRSHTEIAESISNEMALYEDYEKL